MDWDIIIPTPAIQYATCIKIAEPTPMAVIIPNLVDCIAFFITTIISGPGDMAARSVIDARISISDIEGK
jgi:hypothetical protein